MKFKCSLERGTIIRRFKRFFTELELPSGEIITAHTPNTGSMKTCLLPGWEALVSKSDSPTRKLAYTLEMTHNGSTWIGVNTNLPNKLIHEALTERRLAEFQDYDLIQPEFKVGQSRLDFHLVGQKGETFIEVKNVTMLSSDGGAIFPDSISTRGQKHLQELMDLQTKGHRVAMVYVIQREDVHFFRPAKEIDLEYARLLSLAQKKGVEIYAYQCSLSEKEITLKGTLPIEIE